MTKKKIVIIAIIGVLVLAIGITAAVVFIPELSGKPVLYVYNWGDYIDRDTIRMFEREYDIRVRYQTFTTNEDMYVKVESGSARYDVIFPSDYMVKRMIEEGLLQKVNLENIPNFDLIDDQFKSGAYDPNNEYSVPYKWGTVGILYNKTMVDDPVDSWDILWNPKYEKQILMVDSMRDSFGVALKRLGFSMNSTNTDEIEQAKLSLIEQKPLVLAYVVDEAKDKMINNEAALAVVWSGEAVLAMAENENLAYAFPKEGTNVWYDCMVIPANARNKEAAELFINFMNRTDIALLNAEYTGYSTPHREALMQMDAEIRNDPTAYPASSIIENAEVFEYLGDYIEIYNRAWIEITAS